MSHPHVNYPKTGRKDMIPYGSMGNSPAANGKAGRISRDVLMNIFGNINEYYQESFGTYLELGMLFWHYHSEWNWEGNILGSFIGNTTFCWIWWRPIMGDVIDWMAPFKHVQKHGNSLTIIISICSQQRLKKQNNQMVHLCLNNCRHKLYQFSFACSVCHCKRQTEEIDHSYTCYRMSATPHKIFRHEYLSFHYNPIIIPLLWLWFH